MRPRAPLFLHTLTRYSNMKQVGQDFSPANTSAAWPVANKATWYPFSIPFPFDVRRFWVANGAAASAGTWDVGVYSWDGVRLCSAANSNANTAITQAGASVLQYATCSPDVLLPPGSYYFAMVASSVSATYQRMGLGFVSAYRLYGQLEQTSALPLPSTMASAVAITEFNYALFGITSTDSGF